MTVLIVIAVILLALSGFVREGFQVGMSSVRCGVDLPDCQGGQFCINAQCMDAAVPRLPRNELPVFPDGHINGR